MQNAAIWLASIFGPLLTIVGLWMLLYSDNLSKVFQGTKNSHALAYFTSVISLLVGFGILSQYDLWDWNPLILVTLLGWFFVVRGIIGLFIPQFLTEFTGRGHWIKIIGLLPLIWGLALSWVGFFI